ncbi:MAG: dicarboxylate/amino acid:cation symporter [Bacteriovoracaceae bacterium]|nr:dicarboxylate/amino acid:cation symporter [Bacteriovoracaceae bacterium]
MKKAKKLLSHLSIQIFIGAILGVILGFILKEDVLVLKPIGDIFIKLLIMLIVPLISCSIIVGSTSLGATRSAGKIGMTTIFFYLFTTFVASLIGVLFAEIFQPGIGLDIAKVRQIFPQETQSVQANMSFWTFISNMIPSNPVKAMMEGKVIQIIFFCMFMGFGISTLPTEKKDKIIGIFDGLNNAFIWMIKKIMHIAPLGVFALMAYTTGTLGVEILLMAGKLFLVYMLACFVHIGVVYFGALRLLTKVSIVQFAKELWKAQLVAFTTSSSLATLPTTFSVCDKLDVRKKTSSFVLPLGATLNMDGSAIYFTICAVFCAQLFGMELSFSQYFGMIMMATLGSIGQTGIPGPGIFIVAILGQAGIPLAAVPLLYATDRPFDMFRTVVNVSGDATCATLVDRTTD